MSLATVTRNSAVASTQSHAPWPQSSETLTTISAVRRFFYRNTRPIYSIGPTDFNLAGMDEWIANFRHICQIDCYDGRHPNVFVPRPAEHDEFRSIPDINNYLLRHEQVVEHIAARGDDGVAVFLMFDETTEEICREMGLSVWFPAAELRERCDSKVETVRLGNRAGVPSVPNVLARVRSYRRAAPAGGCRRPGQAPGRADAVRRLRPHHVLHLEPRRLAASRGGHRGRVRGQGHAAHRSAGSHARSLRHPLRHRRRAAAHRDRRPPRAHPLPRRLGRQRGLHRRLQRGGARQGARVHRAPRRAAARRRLPRLLRPRLSDRPPRRRALPGRAQPAHLRGQPAHQPRRLRPRRRAPLPVPPAGVLRRRVRPGHRRAERALGRPALHRQLERGRAQEHLGRRRPGDRRTAVGPVAAATATASRTSASTTVARPSRTSARASTCASPAPATGATRAPTWAS